MTAAPGHGNVSRQPPSTRSRDLPDAACRARIATSLDENLFVEAGAGSGKTKSLVDRVVALVAAGVEMRHIAAITFTEKAAAELRDRIRRAFERGATDASFHDGAWRRFRTALEQVDAAAISTLHAFAQRLLTEHPIEAQLPPNVAVLDEVASEIEFEDRWRRFRDDMLDDPALERTLLLAFAARVRLIDLRHLARLFDDNWDLIEEPQRVPWPATEPPPVDITELLRRLDDVLVERDSCTDAADKLLVHLTDKIEPYAQRLRDAPDEYELLRLLDEKKPSFTSGSGRKQNWPDVKAVRDQLRTAGELRTTLRNQVAVASLQRLAVDVARFTLAAAEERRASGRLEFHDLLVLARRLLRGPNGLEVRAAMRDRYRRLLLDEFQDTDPIQIDLAVLIASPDPAAADQAWWDMAAEAGRLFFVGDPKQSIYRFRRADINLFLRASEAFGPPVPLTTNFRTTPPIIDWINHVFARLIRYEAGSQPAYQPLDPSPARTAPPQGPPVVVMGSEAHGDDPNADTLREREAEDVAEAVLAAAGWRVSGAPQERRERSCLGVTQDSDGKDPVSVPGGDGAETWRAAKLGDIAILLPARTSLPALERALEARGIPYRAETSSLVYSTREVRDLLAAVRALADVTDQLSLVTALRSPLFGCGDDDLFTFKVRYRGSWHLRAPLPADLPDEHPVGAAIRYLRDLHDEAAWLAPSELLDRICRDRRLFELGFAAGGAGVSPALHGRPRDLWRRLRFVVDQARAWSEAEGGTLREYLEWARMQASESTRVAEAILPETDDDSVRILTIHASKGLEFPITIVSGTTTASRGAQARVQAVFPPGQPVGIRVGSSLATPEFEAFKPIDEQMDFHERLRLLYVACTRARDHLVVSLHRKTRKNEPDEQRKYTNAELLLEASQDAPHQVELVSVEGRGEVAGGARPDGKPLPDLERWEAERSAALSASSWRRSLGASDVGKMQAEAALDRELDEDAAAGVEKSPRDLELPPWQKGRYGTAIGRAVHGVLQTVDLATGAGLEEASAAQAAAEGVLGREEVIARLAHAALDSPLVKEAVHHPHWRETYVATSVGERTLEGYIDLLYRAEEGLVVVDYKTASAGADLDRRLEEYRWQGGAYALAVEGATGEAVSRVVFLFLTPGGALERELTDLDAAKEEVRAICLAGGAALPTASTP